MISDLRKLIIRQTDMVIKERNREEGTLPLDLWKKPAMKEAISIKRPTLADEFIMDLMSYAVENSKDSTFVFKSENLNSALQTLALSVMRMQREAYEK
ncbi:unnamed protein product [Protopolystoma xenopodis]|uniref:Uncharacterized protein n=1 Tax=Protopolystoma xenopodis TaxID=117903 RepID=A0A3S5BNJ0_9PLAT|nr:unnamed protein product [Protopolystoma xenopodis]